MGVSGFCGERFTGQRDVHSELVWQDFGQPQQAAGRRDEAALDLGQAELGVARGDDQVGGEREFAAAGQRPAFDGGYQRFRRRALGEAAEPPGQAAKAARRGRRP
jgi:hypothetical protein